ncbi:hypothetical protein GCM10010399_60750 [Dactylosporangium fulvum]|uniref:DUF695 domain-containing protein n=1 Tax=Dactylosporangium fulvum TaxID=53359 RepID=A0ABY5VZK9_9ACTN|nr:hypothetical protein [Dactylosporangium fulvum]UWP83243.1 hypothetical protein Dfulv_02755 [Dactylosporangium fulvum]
MYWFHIRPEFREFTANRPGVNAFYQHVEGRIDRALLGPEWLRRRFAAVDSLELRPRLTDVDRPRIDAVEVKRGGHNKRVLAAVSVPGAWFAGRLDGLVGYRLTLMALDVVDAVGEQLGLGACELRRPRQDRGTDELPLFGPRDDTHDGELARRIAADLAGRPPGAWVVTGAPWPSYERWYRTVVDRLDARRVDQPLPTPLVVTEELVHLEVGPGWPKGALRTAHDTAEHWLRQWSDFASSALREPARLVLLQDDGSGMSVALPPAPAPGTVLRECLRKLVDLCAADPRPDSIEAHVATATDRDADDVAAAGLDELAEGELAVVTRIPPGDDSLDETLERLEQRLDGIADVGESECRPEFAYWIVTPRE